MPCLSSDIRSRNAAILVAGGSGTRMGKDLPKQFLPLAGVPILVRTLCRFIESEIFGTIIVVLPASQIPRWHELARSFAIPENTCHTACGGNTRTESVFNGIRKLRETHPKEDTFVAVHDGVRPFVSPNFLTECMDAARKNGNAVPALIPPESFRYMNSDDPGETSSHAIDRQRIRSIQTPQCFRLAELFPVLEKAVTEKQKVFTDEASLMEDAGYTIRLCSGSMQNIKITRPFDLELAEFFLQQKY